MMLRRAALTLLAPALATALFTACADSRPDSGASEDASESPDPISQRMLNSAQSPGMGLSNSVPVASPPGVQEAPNIDIALLGYNSGPEGAPVRVLEFSDFGCGYCRRFHEESFPTLEEEYMATGKVEWKYVPIVIGMFPNAMEAARAGECAGEQDRFPEMRDVLFARQQEWKSSDDPDALLAGFAQELGLEMERFDNCVAQGWQDDRILAGTRLSREVGVRGTPTFFVVGYAPIPGAIPLDLFRQVLDTVYVEATSPERAGG